VSEEDPVLDFSPDVPDFSLLFSDSIAFFLDAEG
jgi:hypothetical protein